MCFSSNWHTNMHQTTHLFFCEETSAMNLSEIQHSEKQVVKNHLFSPFPSSQKLQSVTVTL